MVGVIRVIQIVVQRKNDGVRFFSANSVRSVLKDFTPRSQRPQWQMKRYLRKESIAQPRTRRGAPVAMRCSFSAAATGGIGAAPAPAPAAGRGRIAATRPTRS